MRLRHLPSLLAASLALLLVLASRPAAFAVAPEEPSSRPAAESQPQEGETGEVRAEETESQETESQEEESQEEESQQEESQATESSEGEPEEAPAAEAGAEEGEAETGAAGEEPSGSTSAEQTAESAQTATAGEEATESPRESAAEGEEQAATARRERAASESTEAAPESELSPEEQAKLEELKRKREAIAAKRAEKKARQAEKQERKRLAEEAKQAGRLDVVLAKGYEALYAGKLEAARQAFEKHMELEGGESYGGRLGLARVELARDNPAAAIDQALKAVKATTEGPEKAEALTFAAETTLAARPRDEASGAPLPGTEMFHSNALRYYMQALIADPEGASEARDALEEAFPTPQDERTERFYDRFLESSEAAPQQYAKRLAATYEALLSGRIEGPLAVAGGITPPEKTSGPRPPYPQNPEASSIRRRLVVGLTVEPDGTVSNARVLNGIDAKLDRGAEIAMRQWTFEPARLPNGTPVEVYYVVVTNADVEPLEPLAAEETGEEPTEEEAGRATPARERTAGSTPPESGESARESARRERGETATPVEASRAEASSEEEAASTEAPAEAPPEDSPPEASESPPDQPESEDDQ